MMHDTVRLLVMENARMRLQVNRPVLRDARLPERPADASDATLRVVLFRLACAAQEGELYNEDDGINHVYRHIDLSADELSVLEQAARALRAEQSGKPRNIGELRIWDVLLDAIDVAWGHLVKGAVESESPLVRHLARKLADQNGGEL